LEQQKLGSIYKGIESAEQQRRDGNCLIFSWFYFCKIAYRGGWGLVVARAENPNVPL
jgi:hypothetical protein